MKSVRIGNRHNFVNANIYILNIYSPFKFFMSCKYLFCREAALRRIFSRYDRDGNGRIDRQELGAVLKEMGKVFSDTEVGICSFVLIICCN